MKIDTKLTKRVAGGVAPASLEVHEVHIAPGQPAAFCPVCGCLWTRWPRDDKPEFRDFSDPRIIPTGPHCPNCKAVVKVYLDLPNAPRQTPAGSTSHSKAGCFRSRAQRLLHPQTVEDYGLTVPLGEFLADPEARREACSGVQFHVIHNASARRAASASRSLPLLACCSWCRYWCAERVNDDLLCPTGYGTCDVTHKASPFHGKQTHGSSVCDAWQSHAPAGGLK